MKRTIDPTLPNLHHIVTAQSGGGKTTWVKRHTLVKRAARLIAWDPDYEYSLTRYTSPRAFVRALRKAGNGPLRVALSVDATPQNFEWFCKVMWGVAGAHRPTVVIVDEAADVARVAKASPAWGKLIRRSRKYGMVLFVLAQRAAEIDKTIYSQCTWRWVGFTDTPADQKRAAESINKTVDDVVALKPLDYYYKTPDGIEADRLKF